MVVEDIVGTDLSTQKKISQPPLNLLFNPTLINKEDVWDINVVRLLEILLKLLTNRNNKDLRVCGVAIFTSSLIHRLKVESIFRLEKLANQKYNPVKDPDNETEKKQPIPELGSLALPFRKEISYPVSLEDLLLVLENMITDLTNPRTSSSQFKIKPIEVIDFQEYLIKFEKVIEEYENKLFTVVAKNTSIVFNTFVYNMEKVDVARYFLAMLYLAMKDKIYINTSNHILVEDTIESPSYKKELKEGTEHLPEEVITITLNNQ